MLNRYGLRLNIGHDLDGNIYDWSKAVADGFIAAGHDPKKFVETPTNWNCWEDWGMSYEEFEKEYSLLIDGGLLANPGYLIPGELDFLVVCTQRGHNNHIITSCNEGPLIRAAMAQTYFWIGKHLAPAAINSVTISSDKSVITTDLFFDDKPNNIRKLMDSDCLAPYLVDQPWNHEATDLDTVRVFSPQDKLRALLEVEDAIAHALDLEPQPDVDREEELIEQAFWENYHEEKTGLPCLPEYVKLEQSVDENIQKMRSANERLRRG